MGDRAFVDTNILLRALIADFDSHEPCRQLLNEYRRKGTTLWISGQVMRELLVQATHPRTLRTPLAPAVVAEWIIGLPGLFEVADDTPLVRRHLAALIARYSVHSKQIHDANIAATLLAYEISTLLTLNTADFQRYNEILQIVTLP